MSSSAQFLNPSTAAQRLGVSAKALRLYEQHGLITPGRTAAGWRAYGPDEMTRAAEIVTLRALGLSLSQIARVLGDDPQGLEPALAAHQATLEGRIRQLAGAIEKVRDLRAGLAQGKLPTAGELVQLLRPTAGFSVAFDLPWPWGGERFELNDVRPLNYIIGPLGSSKTRLAKRLAETLSNAVFLGLDRGFTVTTIGGSGSSLAFVGMLEPLSWPYRVGLLSRGRASTNRLIASSTGC